MEHNRKHSTTVQHKTLPRILRKTYDRFIKTRGSPRSIALGLAFGIFIGASPSLGFQTALSVFFASVFKCSKIAAATGVWITNPLTAPFFYTTTDALGSELLGSHMAAAVSTQSLLPPHALEEIIKQAPPKLC